MNISPDTRLGPYGIVAPLGKGGMGEVYRARDTRLDRDVAIKVLPEHLARDPDRLARFEREAKTLAQLNHPNVAGIYGVEEQEGHKYLVLEYVEGETLAARLDRGALPVDEALEVAVQIAAGVEAAHEAGVIHRDLKPGNVMITPDGKAKVLDFGLARSDETSSSVQGMSPHSPTMTASPVQHSPTMPGVILGTAAYMSPEQARGRKVDKRTDIWSFGVILYEMLTGANPFVGETVTDSIGAILHKDIKLDRLPPLTSPNVVHVLGRCLQRDKSLRLRDIGDARIELLAAASGEVNDTTARSAGRLKLRVFGLTGWLAALIAVVALVMLSTRGNVDNAGSDEPVIRLELSAPRDAQFIYAGDVAGPPVVSPVGGAVAFVAKTEGGTGRLWVRDLASGAARALPGTDGATFPFWSPDGRALGFFIRNQLKRYDLESGVSYKVCDAPAGRGGAWTPHNEILFSPGFQDPIFRVSADGGEPVAITTIDASLHTSHRWPFMLPDGKRFLFNAITHDPAAQENDMLMVGSLDGGQPTMLLRSPYRAEYVGGMLLHIVGDDLVAASLDLDTLALSSQRVVLAKSVIVDPSTWYAAFSASDSGVLAYVTRESNTREGSSTDLASVVGAEADTLAIVDRLGRTSRIMYDDIPHITHRESPDATRIAITAAVPGQQEMDIWIYPTGYNESEDLSVTEKAIFVRSPLKRVTSKAGLEVIPAWSPDGSEIAYGRIWSPDDGDGVFVTDVESGAERRVLPPDPLGRQLVVCDWTRDGQWIIFDAGSWVQAVGKLYAVHPDGGEPVPLVEWENSVSNARVSPDTRWLAFAADISGRPAVFVIPFAPAWPDLEFDPAAPEPIWRVSIADGQNPLWRQDGKELYYVTDSGSVIAVQTQIDGDVFRYDTGTALFQSSYEPGKTMNVVPSGERFFLSEAKSGTNVRVVITLNWRRLLHSGAPQ